MTFYLINYCRMYDAAGSVFLALSGTQQRIRNLNMSKCKLNSSAIYDLCKMIQYNTTLNTLNISRNKLKEEGLKIISIAINNNHSLCELDFSNCVKLIRADEITSSINSKLLANVFSAKIFPENFPHFYLFFFSIFLLQK